MRFDRRYLLWGLSMLLVAVLPALAGFAGFAWESAQLCGLVAYLICVILTGASVRPREAAPRTLLTLPSHTLLGWVALAAVLLHAGGLLLADHVVIEYLKLSAPLYQLAGWGAALLLLALTLSALPGCRRRLWASQRSFQATHIALGCALLLLCAVHIVATGRYSGNFAGRLVVIAAAAGAALMLLRARPRAAGGRELAAISGRLVFGRHSAWVLAAVVVTAAAFGVIGLTGAGTSLREPPVHRMQSLPLDFPHARHTEVACATCHHNFVDDRGMDDTCIHCHRSTRADLKVGAEARFHAFCLQCHRHPPSTLTKHGPVSGCVKCHRPPSITGYTSSG